MDNRNKAECFLALHEKLHTSKGKVLVTMPALDSVNVAPAADFRSDRLGKVAARVVHVGFYPVWTAVAVDTDGKLVCEPCLFKDEADVERFAEAVEGQFVLEKMAAQALKEE